ncbi:phytosulfokine 4 precursor [Hibiscus trionum]|uniref:Phytosulfokine n=1 Tax=Hibiscus trionum TaxID=183268 RepID=A0A9W7JJL0_HIBTR|nr:phytosulfokine 4 precursor [Hibiscus trionum]
MSSKVIVIFFLLFFTLSASAARPQPATRIKAQYLDGEVEKAEDSCNGIEEDDECLMRRTLAANVDYIYTQNSKP